MADLVSIGGLLLEVADLVSIGWLLLEVSDLCITATEDNRIKREGAYIYVCDSLGGRQLKAISGPIKHVALYLSVWLGYT